MNAAPKHVARNATWQTAIEKWRANMDISSEILNGLTEKMRSKVDACENAEDLMALAESEGVELTDEQMEMVSGGTVWDDCFTCTSEFYR